MTDREGRDEKSETSAETRRRFIERLAKIAAAPAITVLTLRMTTRRANADY